MTNHDVESAASEPNSIAPMALDVNLWEIDLRNLKSTGDEPLDLLLGAPPAYAEPEPTMVLPRVQRRAVRRVLGAMTTVALIAGLGCATFFARPSVERAFASSNTKSRVAMTTTIAAPVPVAAPSVTPVPNAVPVAATPAAVVPAVPTLSANDLPNAPKTKTKAKRGGTKRSLR